MLFPSSLVQGIQLPLSRDAFLSTSGAALALNTERFLPVEGLAAPAAFGLGILLSSLSVQCRDLKWEGLVWRVVLQSSLVLSIFSQGVQPDDVVQNGKFSAVFWVWPNLFKCLVLSSNHILIMIHLYRSSAPTCSRFWQDLWALCSAG